jgi:hypothetical protein
MSSRTIAIAGSIAALSFAAVSIAQAASTTHHRVPSTVRVDRSRDASGRVDRSRDDRGMRHGDRTPDKRSADRSRDVRDR